MKIVSTSVSFLSEYYRENGSVALEEAGDVEQ